jgi:OmpA-OmpF porin, OOP family
MRVIIIIILWFLLGIGYWFCANECCTGSVGNRESLSEVQTIPPVASELVSEKPLQFRWSDRNPVYGKNWNQYNDSLKSALKANQILQITGLYSDKEENKTKFENLGIARADSVRNAMGLTADQATLASRLVPDNSLDRANLFEAINFNALINSKNVKEETVVDDNNNVSRRTTIYFPFNSTNKLNDSEVEAYLNDVAKRLSSNSEKVQLTGHTDSLGDTTANQALGLARAMVIKNYLIGKGINPTRILTDSKGESSPIASNDTDEGRAKNRRTELAIFN